MKPGGNNFPIPLTALLTFLAFLSLCQAEGRQAETTGEWELGAIATGTSQFAKSGGQQGIGTDSGLVVRELNIGPQNHYPLEILNSTDPKYMVRPYRISAGNGTRRPSICNSGTFTAISPSMLSTQFPMAAMGRFYISIGGATQWCSAMLIGPDTILTALHCVYSCSRGVEIYAGTFYHQFYNGAWANAVPVMRWIGSVQCRTDGIPLYDFAVLSLLYSITNTAIPPTVRSTARALSNSRQGSVYSYPGETKPGGIPYFSLNGGFTATSPAPSIVEVDLSIEMGSSGGPLFVNGLPSDQYQQSSAIMGVTSYEYISGNCPNGFAAFQPGWNPEVAKGILARFSS